MTDLVEKVARAICAEEGRYCGDAHPCDRDKRGKCKCPFWSYSEPAARAALAAIEAEGFALVPMDPDGDTLWELPSHPVEAMRTALVGARRGGICGQTVDAVWRNEHAPERAAYRAMIEAGRIREDGK